MLASPSHRGSTHLTVVKTPSSSIAPPTSFSSPSSTKAATHLASPSSSPATSAPCAKTIAVSAMSSGTATSTSPSTTTTTTSSSLSSSSSISNDSLSTSAEGTDETEHTPRAQFSSRFSSPFSSSSSPASILVSDVKPSPLKPLLLSSVDSSPASWSSLTTPPSSVKSAAPAPMLGSSTSPRAVRIRITTPIHRRIRSDVSVVDPFMESQESTTKMTLNYQSLGKLSNLNSNTNFVFAPTSSVSMGRTVSSPPAIRTAVHRPRANTTSTTTGFPPHALSKQDISVLQKPSSPISTRRRSKTISDTSHPMQRSGSSSLMHSIAEEDPLLRFGPPFVAKRRLSSPKPSNRSSLARFHRQSFSSSVSPVTSFSDDDDDDDQDDADWASFIDSGYGSSPVWATSSLTSTPRSPFSIHSLSALEKDSSFHLSGNKSHGYDMSKTSSSRRLTRVVSLQQEAQSSSDEDGIETEDRHPPSKWKQSFLTPSSSPQPQPFSLLGLGLSPKPYHRASDLSKFRIASDPAGNGRRETYRRKRRSADTIEEQVALHEACVSALQHLSYRKEEVDNLNASSPTTSTSSQRASLAPPLRMPRRRSSLQLPSERPASQLLYSDFASTQPSASDLFDDQQVSRCNSPVADSGHEDGQASLGIPSRPPMQKFRRPGSSESTDSNRSAPVSLLSHGSSLLSANGRFVSHTMAMERGSSYDTFSSTRPSSIASSLCDPLSLQSSRSPRRMDLSLTPVPKCKSYFDNFVDSVESSQREARTELPSPQSLNKSPHAANDRQTRRPYPPARLTSLDSFIAATPESEQLKEEFPDRLLGDWMAQDSDDEAEHGKISVAPLPFIQLAKPNSGTLQLPGFGEIIPPSPDVSKEAPAIQGVSPAWKILGEPVANKLGSSQPMLRSHSTASLRDDPLYTNDMPTKSKPASRTATLKSKFASRWGLSKEALTRATDPTLNASPNSVGGLSEKQSPASRTSNALRKLTGGWGGPRRTDTPPNANTLQLPAAWQERLGPNMDSYVSLSSRRSISFGAGAGARLASELASQKRNVSGPAVTTSPSSWKRKNSIDEMRSRSSLGFFRMLNSNHSNASSIYLNSGNAQQTSKLTPRASFSIDPRERSTTVREPEACASKAGGSAMMMKQASTGAQSGFSMESSSTSSHASKPTVVGRDSHHYHSFFDLSDNETDAWPDDESDLDVAESDDQPSKTMMSGGKKDLRNFFGASQNELSLETPPTAVVTTATSKEKWTASLGRSSKKKSGLW